MIVGGGAAQNRAASNNKPAIGIARNGPGMRGKESYGLGPKGRSFKDDSTKPDQIMADHYGTENKGRGAAAASTIAKRNGSEIRRQGISAAAYNAQSMGKGSEVIAKPMADHTSIS